MSVSERISVLMDCIGGSPGLLRSFKRDDFEADWIKLAECRFGQVYQVQLKLQQEKYALKSFDTALCATNFYRWEPKL